MTVTDLMRDVVVTAAPDTPISDLAGQMRDGGVGSVVVVDGDVRPTGIVTDRDITVEAVARGRDPESVLAGDVMTPDPVTVDQDTGVRELCTAICEAGVRRMPVVDDTGGLTGLVTLDDLVVLLAQEQNDLAAVITAESPAY